MLQQLLLKQKLKKLLVFTSLFDDSSSVGLVEAGGGPGDVKGSEGVDSVRDKREMMDWKQCFWNLLFHQRSIKARLKSSDWTWGTWNLKYFI